MKVGFIGLGTMGASMALNVRKAGFELTVYDLKRDAAKPHLDHVLEPEGTSTNFMPMLFVISFSGSWDVPGRFTSSGLSLSR